MSSNTKIVVLRSKEIVYALVLIVISVLIIMTAVSLFVPQKETAVESEKPEAQSESQNSGEASSPQLRAANHRRRRPH